MSNLFPIRCTQLSILQAGFLSIGLCSCGGNHQKEKQADNRPNIIIILADDLGYSDLGCYGSEIHTPNLDKLAQNGIRFNHFYNAGRSCPTRASLLTGLYPHQAGIGRMTFNDSLPGYQGQMTKNGVTIAELLKETGYTTGMIGKWHVSETQLRPDQREWLAHRVKHDTFADTSSYPTRRGFDDFYGIIYGVVDYFDPFSLVNGEAPVDSVPKDYYITNALSDSAVSYVNRYAKTNKPYFLYLSYTAPHWPLHALEEDIKKYEETYKVGWEEIRKARYKRMQELNIFDRQTDFLSARHPEDSWENNPSADWDARAMAVHAAMVDRMDQGIGKLINALEKNGTLDNTLILFLSDNGCSPEVCQLYSPGENDRPDMMRDGTPIIYPKTKTEIAPGPQNSYASIGKEWANVANTPFRFWKAKTYNGGICTPAIAYWPKVITRKGSVSPEFCHIIDILATCMDVAHATYPATYKGNTIIPLEGKSIVPVFRNEKREGNAYIGFEHFGEKAFISNDGWKIIQSGNNSNWELYNLNEDVSEMKDLSADYPEKVTSMVTQYDEWAVRCKVLPAPK